jgi:hypothetical protein
MHLLVNALSPYGAWGFHIDDSLRGLIAKGKGQPNEKEKAA